VGLVGLSACAFAVRIAASPPDQAKGSGDEGFALGELFEFGVSEVFEA